MTSHGKWKSPGCALPDWIVAQAGGAGYISSPPLNKLYKIHTACLFLNCHPKLRHMLIYPRTSKWPGLVYKKDMRRLWMLLHRLNR